jgi:D-inositol-3-phosphate glycosyltransferase
MNGEKHFDACISVLTAGRDRHYSLGLAWALIEAGQKFDFIGSDELESPKLCQSPLANFLNLRGDQSLDAGFFQKMQRVLAYYTRLLGYAISTRSKIFHILWNNKFELFDRTVLMLFYKLLGKKIAFTAHNVRAGERDGYDSFIDRATLKFQYRLCDRIFVHTDKMKAELVSGFNVPSEKIVLIPYGLNNVVPNTELTSTQARQRLGLDATNKVILFFGNIAPYKGLEYLVEAFEAVAKGDPDLRLIIAGRPKGPENYWRQIQQAIVQSHLLNQIIQKIEYIPDPDIEIYFKAADVLVLPYVHIFQSGVLFLAYSFGLPAIATDVGSLKEEIFEAEAGLVCESKNTQALAHSIQKYFQSNLFHKLNERRHEIQDFAKERHSWNKVGEITTAAYSEMLCEQKNPDSLLKTEKKHETLSFDSHSRL